MARTCSLACTFGALFGLLLLSSAQDTYVDFSKSGPCSTNAFQGTLALPDSLHAALAKTLPLNVTIPDCGSGDVPFSGSPVLVFINGFQARALSYHLIVQRVASWGFTVVQYDLPALKLVNDVTELAVFEPLTDWLEAQNGNASSPLAGRLDLEQLVVGGHSRGGKMATLLFAENPAIRAAFLVDPVDNTKFSPESPESPSASKALAASGRPVGISGAALIGGCNPEGSNYKEFWAAAANGSWLGVALSASHSTYQDSGCSLNKGVDAICGKGRGSRRQVAELTATPMLAWFYQELEVPSLADEDGPIPQPLRTFYEWVRMQELAGELDFEIKGAELPVVTAGVSEEGGSNPSPGGSQEAATSDEEVC